MKISLLLLSGLLVLTSCGGPGGGGSTNLVENNSTANNPGLDESGNTTADDSAFGVNRISPINETSEIGNSPAPAEQTLVGVNNTPTTEESSNSSNTTQPATEAANTTNNQKPIDSNSAKANEPTDVAPVAETTEESSIPPYIARPAEETTSTNNNSKPSDDNTAASNDPAETAQTSDSASTTPVAETNEDSLNPSTISKPVDENSVAANNPAETPQNSDSMSTSPEVETIEESSIPPLIARPIEEASTIDNNSKPVDDNTVASNDTAETAQASDSASTAPDVEKNEDSSNPSTISKPVDENPVAANNPAETPQNSESTSTTPAQETTEENSNTDGINKFVEETLNSFSDEKIVAEKPNTNNESSQAIETESTPGVEAANQSAQTIETSGTVSEPVKPLEETTVANNPSEIANASGQEGESQQPGEAIVTSNDSSPTAETSIVEDIIKFVEETISAIDIPKLIEETISAFSDTKPAEETNDIATNTTPDEVSPEPVSDTNSIEEAAISINNNEAVAEALEVIDEEVNGFTYSPEFLGVFDTQSSGVLALNHLNNDNEQISIVSSQVQTVNGWSPIEVIAANLNQNSYDKMITSITDRYHLLKNIPNDPDSYYVITQSPTKLFKINVNEKQQNLVGELFANSSVPVAERAIGYIHQNGNLLCGSLSSSQDKIFYKDQNDVVTELNYDQTEKPKYVYCLKNNTVLVFTESQSLHTTSTKGQNFLGSKDDLKCNDTAVSIRNGDAYFLCYQNKSKDNKATFKTYKISEDADELITQNSLPDHSGIPNLQYEVKLDNLSSTDLNNSSILFYRLGKKESWNQMPLPTKSAPKSIHDMKLHQGELLLLTQFAYIKYKDKIIKKYPLMFTPKEVFEIDENLVLTKSNAATQKVDSSLDSKDARKSYLNSILSDELDPSPFINAEEKLTALKSIKISDYIISGIVLPNKKVILRKVNSENPDDRLDYTLGVNYHVVDILENDNNILAVIKDPMNKYFLKVYSEDFDEEQSIPLLNQNSKYSVLSVFKKTIFLNLRDELQVFDQNLKLKYTYPFESFSSKRFIPLSKTEVIGIKNRKLVKIDVKSGSETTLYEFNSHLTADVDQMEMIGNTLYLNMKQSRILKLDLPPSIIYQAKNEIE